VTEKPVSAKKERLNVGRFHVEGDSTFKVSPSNLQPNSGGTAEESFVPDVDEGFFVYI
jgi:hypothetical protein